jgi:hypothetical protein
MLALRRVPIFWIHLAASKIQGRKPGSPLSGEKQGQLQGRRPAQVCSQLALTYDPPAKVKEPISNIIPWSLVGELPSLSYSDCEEFRATSNSRLSNAHQ